MMKHLIKLQQDSKTDENTLTQFRFTVHTQMMKTSAAHPNVNSQISPCTSLLLKGRKCLQLGLIVRFPFGSSARELLFPFKTVIVGTCDNSADIE